MGHGRESVRSPFQMLTHQGHLDAMHHAAGGAPDSGQSAPRLTLLTLYNQAGRALFTEHAWNWRVVTAKPPFSTVAGQEWIDLPADFGNPVAVAVHGNSGFRVILTTLDEIMRMRQGQIGYGGGGSYVTFEGNGPAAPDGSAGPRRMGLYPTPTDSIPAFDCAYQSKWVEAVPGKLDLFPNIQPEYEAALMYKGRALARNLVRQSSTIEEGMYAGEILRLKAEDGRRQVNYGVLKGGADDYVPAPRLVNFSGVSFQ